MKTATTGGGRYDAELHTVMAASQADVVLLVVVQGNRGSGFSVVVSDARMSPEVALAEVPTLLRAIADGIEGEQQQGRN